MMIPKKITIQIQVLAMQLQENQDLDLIDEKILLSLF